MARRCRARSPPPADGASGQGRLLGYRGQARAGARARRLSGVHAQGDDRSLLRRLHAAAAGGARAALSAIRHPQCADGRERDRGCRRRRRLRIPAPAWHGRGAVRASAPGISARRGAGLCAGRQPSRPAGLSGAAAARERRQLVVRRRRRRSVGAGRDLAQAPAPLGRRGRACAPSAHPAAARSLRAGAEELRGRRVRPRSKASLRC